MLSEAHKIQGEEIQDGIREIGYNWVGKRQQVCAENPNEKMKRFKLYQGFWTYHYRYEIKLWYGTSHYINCNDMTWLKEDDPYLEERNSNNTVLSILVTIGLDIMPNKFPIFCTLREQLAKEVEKPRERYLTYSIFIHDKSDTLPQPKFSKYSLNSSKLDRIKQELYIVRDLLKIIP